MRARDEGLLQGAPCDGLDLGGVNCLRAIGEGQLQDAKSEGLEGTSLTSMIIVLAGIARFLSHNMAVDSYWKLFNWTTQVDTCSTRSGHLLNSKWTFAQLEMDTCSTRSGHLLKWALAQIDTCSSSTGHLDTCSTRHLDTCSNRDLLN